MNEAGVPTLLRPPIYSQAVEEYTLFYNPDAANSIVLADEASSRLLTLAHGVSLDDAIARDGREAEIVRAEVDFLVEKGLLTRVGAAEDSGCRETSNAPKRGTRPTISVWLHITNACNLRCTYCYIDKSAARMTAERARQTIDQLVAAAKRRDADVLVKFAGGEPVAAFKHVREVVDYAKANSDGVKMRFAMITNGTLIKEAVAEYLRAENFGVSVSLDGPREVNDASRPYVNGRGSYDQVIDGVENLRRTGISPTIMTTVTDVNFRTLPQFVGDMLDHGLRFRLSLERDGIGTVPKLIQMQDELCEILDECYELMESRRPSKPLDAWHKFCDVSFMKPRARVCGAGRNYFAVGQDGSLAECGLGLARPFGKLDGSSDLLTLVRAGSRLETGEIVQKRTGCAQCEWRSSCAGGCPFMAIDETGLISKRSPYCQTMKRVLPQLLRLEGLYLRDQLERRN